MLLSRFRREVFQSFEKMLTECRGPKTTKNDNKNYIQGVPKNVLIECCWSQGAQAQSPVVGTTWAWRVFIGRFLLGLARAGAQSHVDGKKLHTT